MLLSMTGQGQSRRIVGATEVTVEVRAVNNRFFKLQLRTSDILSRLEPQIESLARQSIRRGSLNMNVYISRAAQRPITGWKKWPSPATTRSARRSPTGSASSRK